MARVVEETNRNLSRPLGFTLELWRWETDSFPGFHPEGPQGLIDDLMDIADSDLVVGIFWKRFGTPTHSADSGTEHELHRAWRSWQDTGRPQTMVYFKETAASPKSSAELEQWAKVLQFKERFPKEGLWWACDGEDDLERLFRGHLQRFLSAKGRKDAADRPDLTGYFDAPVVTDAIPRTSAMAELQAALHEAPVVVLGGLSGAGKTYLLSSYLAEGKRRHGYDRVLWHDPTQDESLDNLLALLEANNTVAGLSTHSRSKALIAQLRSENALLVVDNYQLVDHTTYSLLVNAFTHAGLPCRLILISQVYVALPGVTSDPRQVLLPGFSLEEAQELLARRQVPDLPAELLQDLLGKTGGLPFALQLFALLVGQFGHEPRDLLTGAMEQAARIRGWFERILAAIGPNARRLLPYLSVDQSPFNIGVVRLWGRHISLEAPEHAVDELQQRYLVSQHTPYRWKVHELAGLLARTALSSSQQEEAHSKLGHYFLRGLPRGREILSDEEFVWKVRAYRHLWKSEADKALAIAVLDELAATTKARGHYSLFLELSAEVLSEQGLPSMWVRYHHAHCALVLGHPSYCLKVIEPLLYADEGVLDAIQSLAFSRLYAEALGSMGEEGAALASLEAAIEAAETRQVGGVARAQAGSVVAWLQTRLGDYDEALASCNALLADAHKRHDARGGAVALARKGILQVRRGELMDARKQLEASVELFREVGDRRGEGWSLSHLAECELLSERPIEAEKSYSAASAVAAAIGESGVDYQEVTRRLLKIATSEKLTSLLQSEMKRFDLTNALVPGRLTQGGS